MKNGLTSLTRLKLALALSLFMLAADCSVAATDTVKVMTYNILNYPDIDNGTPTADTSLRNPYFRTLMTAVNPDILVVQEMISQVGVNSIRDNVLNGALGGFAAATFFDGFDTDNALFYRTSKFSFLGMTVINFTTNNRDINEYRLKHLLSGDTIRIYSVHLKASNGTANEAIREYEVDTLRNHTDMLPSGSNFIVCGDFNIYRTAENAYQNLKQVVPEVFGHVLDPITMTATWNNAANAPFHTQSPRIRSFGGGVTGGMDDRFDMILYSSAISQAGGMEYVTGSTMAFGNDGAHYNDSINSIPNNAVTQTIADALHYASDHIPVIAKFVFNYSSGATTDVGITNLTAPALQICADPARQMQVQLKNFSSQSINFGTTSVSVVMKATSPSNTISTFTKTLNSGTLAAGALMTVTFDSLYNMTAAGNYTFRSYSSLSSDANHANDTLGSTTVTVTGTPLASISPSGTINICNVDSVLLTASAGYIYSWSNGWTAQSVFVSSAGLYTVTITDNNGCSSVSAPVTVTVQSGATSGIVFYEALGSVGGTTSIATHEGNNGFDNDALTMSGSADIRNTQTSLGAYPGASGGANVFFTNTAGRNFILSGINSSSYDSMTISFGIYKNNNAASGADFEVSVSDNGTTYTLLNYPALPTTSGSAIWTTRVATGAIPSTGNLRIQFKQNGSLYQYRVEDIALNFFNGSNEVTSFAPTSGAIGTTVAISGTGFTGATLVKFNGASAVFTVDNDSQITATVPTGATTGLISVTTSACNTGVSSSTFTVLQNAVVNLKLYIEGYWQGAGNMNSALADTSASPPFCDSLVLHLAAAVSPYTIIYSDTALFKTDGTGSFYFPPAAIGNQYYLVIRHRNSIETWSKVPILINASQSFDLTAP